MPMQPSEELKELRCDITKYDKLLDEATGLSTKLALLENLSAMRRKEVIIMEREH